METLASLVFKFSNIRLIRLLVDGELMNERRAIRSQD
jgi:hypothetical protein